MNDSVSTDLSLLRGYLQAQRDHVLSNLDGLDDAALSRPVLPSGWTCLALVHHLTMNELLWFGCVLGGDPEALERLAEGTDWQPPEGVPASVVLEAYRVQIASSDAILSSTQPDQAFAWWPDFFGEWRLSGVPQLMLHVITEVACHAGHLDAARELIDGRQYLVLD